MKKLVEIKIKKKWRYFIFIYLCFICIKKHLNQEAQQLKNEIDKKEKELEKLHMELKQKNKIILNQEEDLKSLQKQKIMKERVPLQDENKKNAKEYEQQQYENDLEKKIGKE